MYPAATCYRANKLMDVVPECEIGSQIATLAKFSRRKPALTYRAGVIMSEHVESKERSRRMLQVSWACDFREVFAKIPRYRDSRRHGKFRVWDLTLRHSGVVYWCLSLYRFTVLNASQDFRFCFAFADECISKRVKGVAIIILQHCMSVMFAVIKRHLVYRILILGGLLS